MRNHEDRLIEYYEDEVHKREYRRACYLSLFLFSLVVALALVIGYTFGGRSWK